ncbi:uncharacterized protein FOMMEDRAFT_26164 [Fomitiporia mediterranea MF3/22]|uniref:uncharacterized protein n=1 Tax=Fomitiporia mediterranea (strain MF3/22) TaxID=694068 RepID=UPI0004408E76|nr:uncharacterized protein FOMMEDRAFT_26164 [Fomitiporia mediterranea MF3/22]EJD07047.1 hypothetical protein FOMMEDRAFT_26164 [Fomitiporia mediterranea MF3/22]
MPYNPPTKVLENQPETLTTKHIPKPSAKVKSMVDDMTKKSRPSPTESKKPETEKRKQGRPKKDLVLSILLYQVEDTGSETLSSDVLSSGQEAQTKEAFVEYGEEPSELDVVHLLATEVTEGSLSFESIELDSETFEEEDTIMSTPVVHRHQLANNTVETDSERLVKVSVHDGTGLRIIRLKKLYKYLYVLELASASMKLMPTSVELGYKASWSSKTGSKRNIMFITSSEELADFWEEYKRYNAKPGKKCEIVFRNMQEPVTSTVKRPAGRGSGQTQEGARDFSTVETSPASLAARDSIEESLQTAIQQDHAQRLVQSEPGVVPNQVPASMSSRLLDVSTRRRKTQHPGVTQPNTEVSSISTLSEAGDSISETPKDNPPNPTHSGPLNYPTVDVWRRYCQQHIERGRDAVHTYTSLIFVLQKNDCTRLDDVARLTTEELCSLAMECEVEASIGLVKRVVAYAHEDVAKVKNDGYLKMDA